MTRDDTGPRDPIGAALAALPKTRASADFNRRLTERLAAAEAPRRRPRRALRWQLATATALLLAVVAFAMLRQHELGVEARQRRDALELRHAELRRELEDLRARAASSPTLYLGTTDDFDVVLDLGPWMEAGPQPAAYATVSRP
jgi:hypothetical protein